MREIPRAPLESLCEQIADCPHATPLWTDKGVIVLRNQNIRNGRLNLDSPSYTDEEHYQQRTRRAEPRAGDIVITREAPMGEVCELPQGLRCCLGQRMVLLRPDNAKCNGRYLLYALQSQAVRHEILVNEGTGSTVSNLRIPVLEQIPIPVCPLPEQQAIARILGALDDKIDLNRRMNATLEAMARALFQAWFVDFEPVRAKKLSWKVEKLGDVVAINARSIKNDYPHTAIEYIDISSVTQGRLKGTTAYTLAEAPSRAQRLVENGDTIWSCVRPNRRSYLFIDEPVENIVVSTGFAVLSPIKVPPSYLHAWVTTDDFVEYLTNNADGSAYPAVRPPDFARAEMLVPGSETLQRYEDIAGPMRKRIAHNEHENRTLAAVRDTLLPKLITGELRVPDAERLVGRVVK